MCGFASSNKYGISDFEEYYRRVMIRGQDGTTTGNIRDFDYCFSRLALNDQSKAGLQPIYSYCRRYCVLYNGEIYNFQDLKTDLQKENVDFNTKTDTEVFVNLIASYGLYEALKLVHGAFAVAVFDLRKERIFLFRDRFGEKPLFYSFEDGQLSFSSCLSSFSLLSKISPENVKTFCEDGYLTHGHTIYENVHAVSTKEILEYSLEHKTLSRHKFPEYSMQTKLMNFESELSNCVEQISQAEAEVGILLSGGVDSSLIASTLSSLDIRLKCYSFDTKFYGVNELSSAKKVTELLKLEHEILDIAEVPFEERIDEYILSMSEPNTDPSYFALYELARLAGSEVKAVLTGDGADELFLGYRRHTFAVFIEYSLAIQIFLYFLCSIVRLFKHNKKSKITIFDSIYSVLTGNYEDFIVKRKSKYGKFQRIEINKIILAEQQTFLMGQVLRKSDMACIANGVEVRAPYLMPPIVELSKKYRHQELNNVLENKLPLRELLRRHRLASIITKGKKGFQVDTNSLLETKLSSWTTKILAQKTLDDVLDYETMRMDQKTKWNLVILSAWIQNFHTKYPIN